MAKLTKVARWHLHCTSAHSHSIACSLVVVAVLGSSTSTAFSSAVEARQASSQAPKLLSLHVANVAAAFAPLRAVKFQLLNRLVVFHSRYMSFDPL